MPRLTITSSWPSASTAITAVCERTLPMLRLVKKIGVVRLTDDDEDQEDQRRPGAEGEQRGLQQPVVCGRRAAVGSRDSGCSTESATSLMAVRERLGRRPRPGPSG